MMLILVTMIFGVLATPALGYLDPGAGRAVIQLVLASVVALGFFASFLWKKIQNGLSLRRREQRVSDEK